MSNSKQEWCENTLAATLKRYPERQDRFESTSGIEIGSHTLTHSYLPDLNPAEQKKEIFSSQRKWEELFRKPIKTISYPLGGFNEQTLNLVEKAGYCCALSTNRGFDNSINLFSLRRIKITNRDLGIRLWAKLSGFYRVFKKPKNPY